MPCWQHYICMFPRSVSEERCTRPLRLEPWSWMDHGRTVEEVLLYKLSTTRCCLFTHQPTSPCQTTSHWRQEAWRNLCLSVKTRYKCFPCTDDVLFS